MYRRGIFYPGLGEPLKPRFRQEGDFVLREKEWCPELRKIESQTCVPRYDPTEPGISFTEAGHLTPDVVVIPAGLPGPDIVITCRYLIIRDFGVDWRHVKKAPQEELLFKLWKAFFEVNKSLLFRIVGYTDCIGPETKNAPLRKGRAVNVFNLLGPSARSRVMETKAAPAHTFLTDNTTVAGRANNRSVVIEFFVNDPRVI
jgi:hypothetical protein